MVHLCWLQALCIDHLPVFHFHCFRLQAGLRGHGTARSPALVTYVQYLQVHCGFTLPTFFQEKDLSKIWLFWLHHNLNCMKAHDTGNFNDQVLIMSATSEWTCAPPWPVNVRSHHGLPLQRLTWLLHCWETNSVRKQAVNVTHADCSWLWWFSVTLNAPSPIQLKPNWSWLGKVHPTAIFKTCTCLIDTWLLCQI